MTTHHTLPAIEPLEARIAPAFSSIVDVSLLDGSDGVKLSRPTPATFDGFATALSGIGDINDDGIDDYAISAPLAGSGSVYIVFGNNDVSYSELDVSTLDGFNGFRIDGANANDLAGVRVSPAGDFNHDGVADFLLGAPGLGANRGAAYLILGRTGTFDQVFTLGTSTSLTVVQLNGETSGDLAGVSVGGIGDFNNDTYDDIIIGAPKALNGLGSGYIVFGGDVAISAVRNLAALNNSNGFRLLGELNHADTGIDVAGIGDFNDDGFDDIIIGSAKADTIPGTTSYVVFGKSGPFATTLLGNLDGTTGFRIEGGIYPGRGQHLSAAGDINADGFDDFLISSALVKKGTTRAGAFAIFGHAAPFTSPIVLNQLDGSNGFLVKFGRFKNLTFSSVSGAGDVNGDGIDDFMVGSAGFRGNTPGGATDGDSGNSYVIFGRAGAFDPIFDAATLELGAGFSIVNAPATKFFVTALNPAGDINGDGRDDILIGSGKADDLGAAYVVYGQSVYIATDPKSNTVKFNDVDGDVISVTIPGHKLKQGNFNFHTTSGSPFAPHAALVGNDSFFDITLGADFANSTVRISTTPAGGDGYLRLGSLNAPNITLKNVKIHGDIDSIKVGDGSSSRNAIGTLDVHNLGPTIDLGTTTILGTVKLLKIRGSMQNTTMDVGNGVSSGLKKMLITGSITDSQINSTGRLKMTVKGGIEDSTIDAAVKVSSLTVFGDVVNSTIRAVGDGSTAETAKAEAIKRINIKGKIENSHILAGYDASGMLLNGHARIGSVTVKHDWIASDLVAGVAAGADTFFGTADDAAQGGGGFVFPSRIASIIIQGQLLGSAAPGDTFGFVAEQIDKFKIGGAAVFTPTHGANNDLAILTFGDDGDIAIHEVNAPV